MSTSYDVTFETRQDRAKKSWTCGRVHHHHHDWLITNNRQAMCKLVDSIQENSTRVVLKCKISFWGVPTALLFLCVGAADWWPAHGWVKPVSPSSKPHSRPHLSSFHPYWVTRPPWVAESKKTHQTVPKAWTGNVKVIIGSASDMLSKSATIQLQSGS